MFDVCIAFFFLDGVTHNGSAGSGSCSGVEGEDGLGSMAAGVGGKDSASGVSEGLFEGFVQFFVISEVVEGLIFRVKRQEILNDWGHPFGVYDG